MLVTSVCRGFVTGIGIGAGVLLGLLAFRAQPGTAGFTTVVVQILDPYYIAAGFMALGLFALALCLISFARLRASRGNLPSNSC